LCGNRGLIGLIPFYNDDDDEGIRKVKVSMEPDREIADLILELT